jgi:hypothetical protein
MYLRNAISKIIIALFFLLIAQSLFAQPSTVESQQYYEGNKGISYIPVLSKPALIYQGKLYTGKKQLDYLKRFFLMKIFKNYMKIQFQNTIILLLS